MSKGVVTILEINGRKCKGILESSVQTTRQFYNLFKMEYERTNLHRFPDFYINFSPRFSLRKQGKYLFNKFVQTWDQSDSEPNGCLYWIIDDESRVISENPRARWGCMCKDRNLNRTCALRARSLWVRRDSDTRGFWMNRWIAKIRFNRTIDVNAYNLRFHGYIAQYH